jgi:BlaI family transcriptional regulator, penicillinase repressor
LEIAMPSFTERELDIMSVLWTLGSGTVTEVRERLDDDLAYNTVLSVLRTLEAKGHVRHEEQGKAHRYHPTVERAEAGTSGVRRLLDKVFDGSAEALLTQLVNDKRLTRKKLAAMRALLDERLADHGEKD